MRRSRDRRIHAGSSQGARAHPLPRPDAEAQSSLGSGLNLPPIRRRLLAGGSWAFFGKAVNVAGAVAISALLARLLSPENMGAYFLAFSVVTGMALAARMGLDNSVVKIVAESLGLQEYTRARQVLKPLFMLAALSTLVIASVVWLFAGRWLAESVFGSPAMAGVTGLIALWIVALAFQQLLAETFRGFHNIRLATLIGGSVTTLLSALAYASVWFAEGQANLATAVALRVTATGITVAAAAWLLLRTVRPLQGGDPSPVPARAILHESWPLLISNVTYYVLTHADLWILGAYLNEQDVAVYGAAARLVLLVNVSLIIANQVLPPIIGELYIQGKKKRLERVLRSTAALTATPAVVVLSAFILFGRPLLKLVFGTFYEAGATVLLLLSIAQLSSVWVGSCGYTLIMTGHQRTMMGITVLSGVVTVVGGILVVRPFGMMGVAAVVAIAIVLQQILMLAFVRISCGIWTHASPLLLVQSIRALGDNRTWRRRGS